MKFTILGSGGAIRIPRACCTCSICKEARQKGFPYKRLGQSLFLHDGFILFDTPEDINEELNCHSIPRVDHIFYSHWHPDHTLGCRIIETLMDGSGKQVDVHIPKNDINITINQNPVFEYYRSMDFCNVISTNEDVYINKIRIRKIQLKNEFAYAFLICQGNKRVLYCPCHTMHIPYLPDLYHVDLMILAKGYSTILNDEWTNFERDTLRIIKELHPKRAIITHIEETDGIGYDEYKVMEKDLRNIEFGYDGQVIEI
ncbi:MAG: hypothetical protein GX306_02755 [Clostridiales bacterium]|jgi:phosphoribosyl 1,2-cyclic phosphate phosphodiesterase|nr:hypothetical protein [Clostridiales bacterium]